MALAFTHQYLPSSLNEGKAGQREDDPRGVGKAFPGRARPLEQPVQEAPRIKGKARGEEKKEDDRTRIDEYDLEPRHKGKIACRRFPRKGKNFPLGVSPSARLVLIMHLTRKAGSTK